VDVGVGVGITPAQVGFQDIARHLVRADASMGLFHEGEVTQPLPQLRCLLGISRQHCPEYRFSGDRGVRAHLQRSTMPRAWSLVDQLVEQGRHDVGQILQRRENVGSRS
jgi:hypothetical protein